ncbi:hypothetical protein H5410_002286, partial [Solanum commersonii]
SSIALTVNPIHRRVISIAEITTAASVGFLHIEAEMSISYDLQKFCKQFDCAKCQRHTTLVPRYYVYAVYINLLWCTFQIDLIDGSGSTSVFIFGDPAEKLLSMKNQLLCVDQTQQMLSKRLFHIQLRK